MKKFKGKTALVTGASAGIGKDCAELLASAGTHLILVARREAELKLLQQKLETQHGVQVYVYPCDLSHPDNVNQLCQQIDDDDLHVDILVNNAGFGSQCDFVDQAPELQSRLMNVNMVALTILSRFFAEKMVEKGEGYILQVASVAGWLASSKVAMYDATKAYVLLLSEGMHAELKHKEVTVTVLCPGATKTEFFDVSGVKPKKMMQLTLMTSREVAAQGLKGLAKGRMRIVPGLINKLTVVSLRLVPRNIIPFLSGYFVND